MSKNLAVFSVVVTALIGYVVLFGKLNGVDVNTGVSGGMRGGLPSRTVSRLLDRAMPVNRHAEADVLTMLFANDEVTDPSRLVIDVGANVGRMTSAFLAMGYRVIAMDASPSNVKTLHEKFDGNPKVTVVGSAAGEEASTLQLHVFSGPTTSDSFVDQSFHHTYDNRKSKLVSVPVSKLDDVVPHAQLHVLKTDTQGFELNVLRGAKKLLSENRVNNVFVEFWPKAIIKNGQNPKDILELLHNHGFTLYEGGGMARFASTSILVRRPVEPSFDEYIESFETDCPEESKEFGCFSDILGVKTHPSRVV